MNEDVTDGVLVDVTRLDLGELLAEADESSLARALGRVLACDADGACNGFQSSI
jgi:FXSXX-COOH protein